jgi:hypothetical protein
MSDAMVATALGAALGSSRSSKSEPESRSSGSEPESRSSPESEPIVAFESMWAQGRSLLGRVT